VYQSGKRVMSLERKKTFHRAGALLVELVRAHVLTAGMHSHDRINRIQSLTERRQGSKLLLRKARNARSKKIRVGANLGNEI
jgi:hypothetical protein